MHLKTDTIHACIIADTKCSKEPRLRESKTTLILYQDIQWGFYCYWNIFVDNCAYSSTSMDRSSGYCSEHFKQKLIINNCSSFNMYLTLQIQNIVK